MTRADELREFASYGEQHPDECVLWPYAITGSGYPNLSINRTNVSGHRWVCEQKHGPCPEGKEASHSCGNATCVNPHHIVWATHAENIAMKRQHGTENFGEKHPTSKVTAADVRELRAAYRSLIAEWADRLGLTESQVRNIISCRSWFTQGRFDEWTPLPGGQP